MRFPVSIETRTERAGIAGLAPLVIAMGTTAVASIIILSFLGVSPVRAIYYLYLSPFLSVFNLSEVILKAGPLMLIAQALAIGFRARVWNIGAEGQLIFGAIGASLLPIWFNTSTNPLLLPAMAMMGAVFGMAWASIAAFLRTRFNANEILVTLMLNSIALQLLYYLVSGPLRDPMGFNFPQSSLFPQVAMLPILIDGTRANISILIALLASFMAWVFMERSFPGYRLQVGGLAPEAARYAGFSEKRAIWVSLLLGGMAAGLAGAFELAGPLGQLQRVVSPGYGFAAITVAFLGGLRAPGIVAAAFFMAVVYVGGDIAQTSAEVPYSVNTIIQGLLLVTYIAARVLIDYRVRINPKLLNRKGAR